MGPMPHPAAPPLPPPGTRPCTLPSAVLFDMDGTLVDTEPSWFAAEAQLVADHGGTWTETDSLRLVGWGLEDAAAELRRAGVRLGVRAIVDELLTRVVAATRARTVHRAGARELVEALRARGVPLALVTSSEAPLAEVVIASLGGPGVFDVVVTGDLGHPAKPAPDPYLRAAAALARHPGGPPDPARMLAVEDSRTGIRSATAAGLRTLAVPHLVPVDDAGAHHVLPTLAGVGPEDLGRLVAGARS